MSRLHGILASFLVMAVVPWTIAHAFTASGRFLYEDRLWDQNGYTGQVQNLPIRHADVDIVDATTQQVLATGSTDEDGFFAIEVTGQTLPLNLVARCLTDGRTAGYEIRVVDQLVRGLGSPVFIGAVHAINTDPVLAHDPANDLDFGTYLIEDTDGTGVAQAYNIFDNAVDFFDWMAQPGLLGRLPNASEFVVFGWAPTSTNEGSNYSGHAILISSPGQGNDTDGWSDTVILHETGHWFDDTFSRSDNPGGAHFIGDNNQNPLLSYGEGVATFHCAKVRDWRSQTRTNLSGQPIDDHISIYADLEIPPDPPATGALSFAYDFETGILFVPGATLPIGQRGSANETNVTSAQWDLVDGPNTADETPGVDDDAIEVGHDLTWDIERDYLPSVPSSNPITVEDYYQGWFDRHGAGFMKAEVDFAFIDLALMEFEPDAFEPDDDIAGATPILPVTHAVSPTGNVVLNEIDPGPQDAVELYNASDVPVELTGWQLQVYVNGDTAPVASRIFTFPTFTLDPGEVVAVFERGDPLQNGARHLYAGDVPNAFNMSWAHGGDGACELRDDGGVPVDFVRWRSAGGVDNTTPTPAGLTYTGVLDSPSSPPINLARDVNGTDTDDASDFSTQNGSLASANHPAPEHHTLFDVGDHDVFAFQAQAGTRYGFEARAAFSASDPLVELLSPQGVVLGSNDDSDPGVRDARVDFFASQTATFYVRVRHVGPFTDWAAYDLLAFQRPPSSAILAPSGVSAEAANFTDVGDPVVVRWLNSSPYDSVRVYRNDVLIQVLPGSFTEMSDNADRGLYFYEVSGDVGGSETARAGTYEFAGDVHCNAAEDFEQGNADLWITAGSNWDVTPLAESGSWGFTDSPAGTYQGCPTGAAGCSNSASAVFGVPTLLPNNSVLTFDQICIVEHCDEPNPCDLCILEISTDDGDSWVELARFTQADDPAWQDNVADPSDWRPAQIDLSAYANEEVLFRFRVQADQLLELDGWYIDNVRVNDTDCVPVAVEQRDEIDSTRLQFLAPAPNPMIRSTRLAFVVPRTGANVEIAIYDVAGRLVQRAHLGKQPAGVHVWQWRGDDLQGRSTAAGLYFAMLRAGNERLTRKVLKLSP